jgi:hypothetical protein
VGYQLTLCENDLTGRAVDPPDKAHQPQKFSLVDRAECDAIELFFSAAKNYRSPLQNHCHDANRIDHHECCAPEHWGPKLFVLKIVIWQYHALADERQNAQHDYVSY